MIDDGKSEGVKRGLSHSDSPDLNKRHQGFTFEIAELQNSISAAVNEKDPPYVPLIFQLLNLISEKMDVVITNNYALEVKVDEHEKTIANQNQKIAEQEKKIADQEKKLDELEKRFTQVALTVDKNEQHSRNECLLLHNIPEEEKESADSCKKKFVEKVKAVTGIDIHINDIKRAHRFGGRKVGKSRPIIARFNRPEVRNNVFRNKRKFKGQKIDGKSVSISENLTPLRLRLLDEAREKYGRSNVWSIEGRLYAMNGDNKLALPIKL